MTIEGCGEGKFLITLSREDLRRYDVDFAAMRLSEPHTKQMVSDLMRRIGQASGMQAIVECAQTRDMGCIFLITLRGTKHYIFESADDVISAANAGLGDVLGDGLMNRDGIYYFTPLRELSQREKDLLGEFCSSE